MLYWIKFFVMNPCACLPHKAVLTWQGLVGEWERKLNLFSKTFEEWMTFQRSWLYLETIFAAADIQRCSVISNSHPLL